jgi:surface polysaccharide O-acyltransferase-like enzyme
VSSNNINSKDIYQSVSSPPQNEVFGESKSGEARGNAVNNQHQPGEATYKTREKAGGRVFYYDAIKFLAIFLVCIYHYNNLESNILVQPGFSVYVNYYLHGFSSMAVPLFFMVNGALLLNRSYKFENHLKKTFHLYILFYLWSAISLAIFILIDGGAYSLREFLKEVFYLKADVSNHLWFLQALISVYLLFPFIKVIYDLPQRMLLTWLCAIIFVFSFGNLFLNGLLNVASFALSYEFSRHDTFDFFPIINPFGNYFYAVFYFIAGGVLAEKVRNNEINISKVVLAVSFIAASLVLFMYGILMTVSNNAVYDTVWNGNSSIMTLIMSVSTVLFFSKLDYKNEKVNRYLVAVSSGTLGIYFVHRFVGATTLPYFKSLTLSTNLLSNILYTLILMLASLLITIILNKLPVIRKLIGI